MSIFASSLVIKCYFKEISPNKLCRIAVFLQLCKLFNKIAIL